MNTHIDNEEAKILLRLSDIGRQHIKEIRGKQYPIVDWVAVTRYIQANYIPNPTKSSGELEELCEGYYRWMTDAITDSLRVPKILGTGKAKPLAPSEFKAAINAWHTTQTTKLQNQRLEDFLRWHNARVDTFNIGFDLLNEFYDHLEREHKIGEDGE